MAEHNESDIRHEQQQVRLETQEAMRDTYIESNLEEILKDKGVFQEFLKESASEELNDELHHRLLYDERYPEYYNEFLLNEFKEYCRQSLGRTWDNKELGV